MSQLQAEPGENVPALRLMVRPSCMLCLEAEYVLFQAGIAIFDRIDIERIDGFESRYGTRIPVLARADGTELDWPFDAARLHGFIVDGKQSG